MAKPLDADRSLLERLNALKPSTVNLYPSSNSIAPTEEKESREDALSARLRTLRNRPESHSLTQGGSIIEPEKPPPARIAGSSFPLAGGSSPVPHAAGPGPAAAAAQPPCDATPLGSTRSKESTAPLPSTAPARHLGSRDAEGVVDEEADDPLFLADDKALDDFLEGLSIEDGEQGREAQCDLGRPPGEDEAMKVAALLESIEKDSSLSSPRINDPGFFYPWKEAAEKSQREGRDGETHEVEEGDDDSEGEVMAREVDDVLSRALDEVHLDEDTQGGGKGEISQATVAASASASASAAASEAGPFSLPVVPTALADPAPPSPKEEKAFDFDKDMAARFAALKGMATDEFGMPSAPTFQPEDHSPAPAASYGPGPWRKTERYSDEDQKTWCVVCLEDATVRCLGCDDDVYCERCWRSMHVGPAAGFDERGHKRVRFER